MSERPPDFDALVGEELDAQERERLRRVHDMLVAAGPPPEAPVRPPVVPLARRRRGATGAGPRTTAPAAWAVTARPLASLGATSAAGAATGGCASSQSWIANVSARQPSPLIAAIANTGPFHR